MKKIFNVLLCITMFICSATGCRADNNSSVDSTVEQSQSIEYKTIEPTEDGWTIEELFSVTYLCDKQLSYPLTVESLADGLELDMDKALYGIKNGVTNLYYNGEFLGTCCFPPGNNPTDMPDLIESITVNNRKSDLTEYVVFNGIKLGDSKSDLYNTFGKPDYISADSEMTVVKYYDKNDDTMGLFFWFDSNTDELFEIIIQS